MNWDRKKVEISRLTLYNLFRVHDAMKLLKEWENLDDEYKADKLFNILIKIEEKHNSQDG